MTKIRRLIVVLGDQLNADSAVFDGFDNKQDRVWMAEARSESEHVWSHKARIVLFLSAMRHFHEELRKKGIPVDYHMLDDAEAPSLGAALQQSCKTCRPQRVVVVQPGDWRVLQEIRAATNALEIPLEVREDRHFYCGLADYQSFAQGRKQWRLEHFYRALRKKENVLMEGDAPLGGRWNYDQENRRAFGQAGPPHIPPAKFFPPTAITKAVINLVNKEFPKHPGRLDGFAWPVTRRDALAALKQFMERRLSFFGAHQDAMWTDEPFLSHALLSSSLNLKLLNPREVVRAAVDSHGQGRAPLASVEGFVRQVLGWREYVRAVYWTFMPEYLSRNALNAREPLPGFYWTGDTEMNCLRQVIGQTLEHGYAHHIQRLMVTGLFALLFGVDPVNVHKWYLSVYVDAVEWVELPNTLGMSQFADHGVMGSKPYAATGKYIKRMSNYCRGCPYDPDASAGSDACPFTTLYWDFMIKHAALLRANPRMAMQVNVATRMSEARQKAVKAQASQLRKKVAHAG